MNEYFNMIVLLHKFKKINNQKKKNAFSIQINENSNIRSLFEYFVKARQQRIVL